VLNNTLAYADPTGLKPCLQAGGRTGDDGELEFDDDLIQMSLSGCPDAPDLGSTDTQARLDSLTSGVSDSQSVSQQSSNRGSFDPGSMAAALFSPQIGGAYFGGANNLVTRATIGTTAAYGGAFFAPAIAGGTSSALTWGANTSGLLGPATYRIFWSGSGYFAAQGAAQLEEGSTLESTLLGRVLENTQQAFNLSYSTTKPIWDWASASFAQGARGSATMYQGLNGYTGQTWNNIESVILKARDIPILIVPF